MQKPAYRIKVGPETFDSSTSSEILSINIDCDISIPLDIFRIVFTPGGRGGAIKKGDETTIELGYEGSTTKVFTGTVDAVEPGAEGTMVTGYSVASALTRLKVHQVYEKQSAGAIVSDLAQQASVKAKDPEEGISFPMYVVDDSKSAYEHMKELASLCGFDLYMLPDGQISFKKYSPGRARVFKYGRDVLTAVAQELSPRVTGVKVFEESPSSSKGADTAHWLSKNVMGGSSGGGGQAYIIRHPAIRDKDTADKVAAARLESLLVSLKGSFKAIGNPRVGLGSTIELREMPDERMNGEFEAVKVSHSFTVEQGYVTTVGWIKKVTITPGEPPMVEPLKLAPPAEPGFLEEQLQNAQEAMEEAKEKLVDAVESAEEALEGMLEQANDALAEADKMAAEAIAAAGEAKKAAEDAANEGLKYADKLKQELEDRKKKLAGAIEEAEKKYREARDKAEAGIANLEGEGKVKEAEDRYMEEKQKLDDTVKELEGKIDEATAGAKKLLDEANAKYEQAVAKAEEGRKEAARAVESLKGAYKEARDTVMSARRQAGLD